MGKVKLILMTVMACCLSVALAGVASAAAITCGDCHGAPPVNGDNCASTARGLHGTHVNYSSSTFKKTVANYGKCSYCHTATAATAPTTTHNNNYINITGNVVGGINSSGLDYSTPNCTSACHKNRAQTAKWGNYTATAVGGVVLNCRSCHDDITDKTGLSFAHNKHLLSNCTTAGAYGLMSAAANAGCQNCHPDQRTDLWSAGKADDGTKKAYPHAADGTNVVAANATVSNSIVSKTGTGTGATCGNNCHKNTATATWGGTLSCDACHYQAASPTKPANDAAVVKLGGAHSAHFNSGKICTQCHPNRTDNSHARSLVISGSNLRANFLASVNAGLNYTRPAKTCSGTGTGCHGSGVTPGWDSSNNGCTTCHYYPGGGARDWTGTNGHMVRYDTPVVNTHLKATGYAYLTDNYSTVVNDNTKCGQCHHVLKSKHNNGSNDMAAVGSGNCGGNFTITVTTSGSNVTCGSVKCHSGKTTPNWW